MSEISGGERERMLIEPEFGDVVICEGQEDLPVIVYITYLGGGGAEVINVPDPEQPRRVVLGTISSSSIVETVGRKTFDEVLHTLAWAFTQTRTNALDLVEPDEEGLARARESFARRGVFDEVTAHEVRRG